VKDKENNLIGILSSLSLFKQNEINRELTENLTFIFGSYISAIIVLLLLVNIITDRLSKPILELKAATEKLSKGQTNFEIKIDRNDEFGSLVDSFNKMTKQLARSKIELKKAEREAAWRDIARRVAHEIKNPLTPMKLSIQHLFEMYKDKRDADFGDVLLKTKDMITSEVDKLNKIATEFSNFAKLPGRNYEPLKINDVIKDVVSLYSAETRIEFRIKLDISSPYIYADRQELNRIFQNLIKNAIQAIEDDGLVEITSSRSEDLLIVKIIDNGEGMAPETIARLFTPNFSTKGAGMGLGLAITKKSLDDMAAIINFTSKENIGTTVEIIFKVYNP
jgi:nitrogen fixation/metabolism regulation signal transduction histidine kinase